MSLLQASGVNGASLLDIGGGVGVIPQEMLKAGASRATSVDAYEPHHATVQKIASEHGYTSRWTTVVGDFVEFAADVAPADVVTLDKVICCYPDMPVLVNASASKAKKLYGVVVPKDAWWVHVPARVGNLVLGFLRFEFQGFVHPLAEIDAAVEGARPPDEVNHLLLDLDDPLVNCFELQRRQVTVTAR